MPRGRLDFGIKEDGVEWYAWRAFRYYGRALVGGESTQVVVLVSEKARGCCDVIGGWMMCVAHPNSQDLLLVP